MTQPGLETQLRAGGAPAIAVFVEEVLRLYGPTPYRMRTALKDTVLGGVEIKAGDYVIGLAHAAHRDPTRYVLPQRVELERTAPRDHYSFGIP